MMKLKTPTMPESPSQVQGLLIQALAQKATDALPQWQPNEDHLRTLPALYDLFQAMTQTLPTGKPHFDRGERADWVEVAKRRLAQASEALAMMKEARERHDPEACRHWAIEAAKYLLVVEKALAVLGSRNFSRFFMKGYAPMVWLFGIVPMEKVIVLTTADEETITQAGLAA